MHVFIAGGSGRTGRHVIDKLIEQGHTVTALIRNPSDILSRAGLKLVQGTPADKVDIRKAFETSKTNPDAVIITLAHVKDVTFDDQETTSAASFLEHVARNIVSVAREYTASRESASIRIVYMSAFGVGDSFPGLNFLMKGAVILLPFGKQFEDHERAENIFKTAAGDCDNDGKLQYVIVRPVMLKNGKEAKVESLGEYGEKASFMPSISRMSVAKFMVDAALGHGWGGKVAVIANQ